MQRQYGPICEGVRSALSLFRSYSEAARALGIGESVVRKFMRGESSFSLERLDEVAAKLNLVVCHSDARPDAIAEVVKTAGSPKSRQLMRELFNVNLPEPNPPSAAEVPDGVVADSLGAFLRSHRVRRQWSQEYVATKAGLGGGRAQLSRFETNEHAPRWSTLQRLAAVLEFDPEPWKQGLKAARGQQS